MTPKEFDAICAVAAPRGKKPRRKYTQRELIDVATDILKDPKFRADTLRWLNKSETSK